MSKRKRVILGVGVVLLLGGVGFWRLKAQPAMPSFLRKFPNVRHVATRVFRDARMSDESWLGRDYMVEAQPEDVVESLGNKVGFDKIRIRGGYLHTADYDVTLVGIVEKSNHYVLVSTAESFTETWFDRELGKQFSGWQRFRYGEKGEFWGSNRQWRFDAAFEMEGLKKRYPEIKVD